MPGTGRHASGAVNRSSRDSRASASSRQLPHMSGAGASEPQTRGRSGLPEKPAAELRVEIHARNPRRLSVRHTRGSATKSTARCSTLRSRDDSETAYFHFPCRILYRYGMKNASQPPAGGATQSVCPDIRLFFRKHSSSAGCSRLLVAASPFSGHAAPPEVSVTLPPASARISAPAAMS